MFANINFVDWSNTDNKSGTCNETTGATLTVCYLPINNLDYTLGQQLICVEKDDPGYCSNITVSAKNQFGKSPSPVVDASILAPRLNPSSSTVSKSTTSSSSTTSPTPSPVPTGFSFVMLTCSESGCPNTWQIVPNAQNNCAAIVENQEAWRGDSPDNNGTGFLLNHYTGSSPKFSAELCGTPHLNFLFARDTGRTRDLKYSKCLFWCRENEGIIANVLCSLGKYG